MRGLAALLLCAPSILAAAPTPDPVPAPKGTETNGGPLAPLKPQVVLSHGPQKPSAVPVLPGLNTGRSLFSGGAAKPASEPCYEPAEGDSFLIRNGPRKFNHILTAGVWYLLVGDRPALKMTLRSENGAYALPALLPGLGIEGEVHLAVTAGGKTQWLDRFDSVVGVLSPGSARWTCSDTNLGVTVELGANPFQATFGFAATATVRSQNPGEVTLTWLFGANGGNQAVHVKDDYAEVEVLPGPAGGYAKDKLKYTRVFVGLAEPAPRIGKGTLDAAREARVDPAAPKPYALLETRLKLDGGQPTRSRFVCVWGYTDYDRKAVAEAYARLDYKPFADPAWVEAMKPKWFEHWVGRGLEPEKKFLAARADSQGAVEQAVAFERRQRHRLRIATPDARFDNVMNNTAAVLRRHFEYPAFAHGVAWLKYGKISCGYYGYQACGYHEEVADSLKFISGTQDVKGRQRYFEPVFAIASWCEEQNFYFVHQVWHHYCWTGDRQFLKTMWPSVLRAIDHALVESDPDGDGIMTGYYEQWNCDGHGRGGKSAIWTGVGLAALRAVERMAEILGGRFQDPLNAPVQQFPRPAEFLQHYGRLRERTENKLKSDLWDPAVGAYCSAEWNGDRRPRPEAMDQSWFIWRGVGEPMDNYMAMRYVRESFHLKPAPGLTLELMNDWWPIAWSHHYVANGDTAFSVASACQAGDGDGFWPALKSITETAYRSDNATLFHGMANDGTGRGMSQIVEIEPMVMLAVVEGVFGVHPQFGENRLVLRPNLPNAWDRAAITTEDFSYQFHRDPSRIELRATTPVPRKLRVEVPVRAEALAVSLNGEPVRFTLQSAVNGARVVVDAPEGKEFSCEVRTGAAAAVEGSLAIVVGQAARFRVRNATVVKVHDPQAKLERMAIHEVPGAGSEAALVARVAGKGTVFLELEAGRTRWLHPLDLDVRERWQIVEKNLALHIAGGPSVASPAVDLEARVIRLEIANPTGADLSQEAAVTVAGWTSNIPLRVAAGSTQSVAVSIDRAWESLSPGTVPVTVQWADRTVTASAVNWRLGTKEPVGFKQRLRPVDLAPFYDIALTRLYGKEFFWRHDYTGCGLGIDWRDPVPLKDALGYYLPTRPIDQFEYQTLPEGVCGTASFEPLPFAGEIATPFGISFVAGAHPLPAGAKGNILALACTEPYEQLPSQATLAFPQPQRLEKIYLLTANLTKTVKCYYPGAEVIVHYTTGETQTHQLIPPYTMSCFGQTFCPRAYAIPFGKIHGDATPLRMGGMQPHLAVTDVVLDAARAVRQIELRCVASETIFGIMGITLLEAVAAGPDASVMPSGTAATTDPASRVANNAGHGVTSRTRTEPPRAATASGRLYDEAHRPQFHFTYRKGWMSDINGLVYYGGEYHFFSQHNPAGPALDYANIHWGHALSRDLIHWTELPPALSPDKDGPIFSGSAVVDWKNTSGLQTGQEPVLVAFYTAARYMLPAKADGVQSMAYSNDRGRTWTKYAGNPVLPAITHYNRDPKVFWHGPTGKWVMVITLSCADHWLLGRDGDYRFAFLSSPDLKHWKELSRFDMPRGLDCPDLFELPVDDNADNRRWVLWAGDGTHAIGTFDGTKFVPTDGIHLPLVNWPEQGANGYAAQTFSDMAAKDGRRIQIAWLRALEHGGYPEMPFNQQALFPVELTLRTVDGRIQLFREPVREVEQLHGRKWEWTQHAIRPGEDLLSGIRGELFELRAEIEPGNASEVSFRVRGATLRYVPTRRTLSCLDRTVSAGSADGKLRLQLLIDRTTLEIFADRGRTALSFFLAPGAGPAPLGFTVAGGEVHVRSLTAWEMKSIWPRNEEGKP